MHADELREIGAGLWFPMKVTVLNYDRKATRGTEPVVISRTDTVVEKVALNPHHDLSTFCHDIEIPDGLPVFTIGDETLVWISSLPEPIEDEAKEEGEAGRCRQQDPRSGAKIPRS